MDQIIRGAGNVDTGSFGDWEALFAELNKIKEPKNNEALNEPGVRIEIGLPADE